MTLRLETITSPAEIKQLPLQKLPELCAALRKRIIDVMSVNGGHLASNLGSVELTVALHYVFISPKDRFIFDVSHQTYAHKILTGRNNNFPTIRKYKGLCGFASPDESKHDHFFAGHAGTALSLGLGMAKDRDLENRDEFIIPIIGDATLTCGLTYEALNNIPKEMKNFIIILNDNKMSIAKNVGAITSILSQEIAPCSDFLAENERTLHYPSSTAPFFEQYGLSYSGPVDGHDVISLVKVLEKLKKEKSSLLHIHTVKGKGMETAIENPVTYHGVKPFDPITGLFHNSKQKNSPTFPKIFGKYITKLAEKFPHLVAVTPAMPAGSCLLEMMDKFPERCLDVGIAEGHAVTFAGGLAKTGKSKVIVSIYATFLQRALDNLFHDVCLQKIPVIFALDRGGIAGGDGSTHNGIYDIGFLRAMPGLVIAQPRDGHLLKELLYSSLNWNLPTTIRYPNLPTTEKQLPICERLLGKSELLASGSEILLIGLGHKCETALEVRANLQKEGLTPSVLDPIFIKPLDTEMLLALLQSHHTVVIIEEHAAATGLGAAINDFIMENGISNVRTINFAICETFVEHGDHFHLTKELGLDSASITKSLIQQLAPAVSL